MNNKLQKKITIILILFLSMLLFPIQKTYGTDGRVLTQQAIDAPIIDITFKKAVDIHTVHTAESFSFIDGTDYFAVADVDAGGSYEPGSVYLVNISSNRILEDSYEDPIRNSHADAMAYDPKENNILIFDKGDVAVFRPDINSKKITELTNRRLHSSGGTTMGHDVITDKFVSGMIDFNNNWMIVQDREQFYAGGRDKCLKRFTVPQIKPELAMAQGGEPFNNYYYYMFSIHEKEFSFDGERNIRGNAIAIINLETGKVEKTLYCGNDDEMEYQEIDFDAQGNLYISDYDGALFKTNFNAYTMGTIANSGGNTILEFIVKAASDINNLLSDLLQTAMEMIERWEDYATCSKLTKPIATIQSDQNLNKEIQAAGMKDNIKVEKIKEVNIPATIDNRQGVKETVYTEGTEIPVITMSWESFLLGNSKIFDIDFITKSNKNSNSFWRTIRTCVSFVSHGMLYICAAALITMLIIRSIMLILSNMRNLPESAAQSKKIMDRWTKAIAIISGIFVLMAVMIYLYKLILDTMVGGVYTPYLIRMNVNGASSFNTNFMGFLKYRSLSINLYDAYKWSLIRLIFTVINLLFFIAMFIRMIILAGLVIIAPATSIGEMINIPLIVYLNY